MHKPNRQSHQLFACKKFQFGQRRLLLCRAVFVESSSSLGLDRRTTTNHWRPRLHSVENKNPRGIYCSIVIAPVGQISSAATTDSCNSAGGFSFKIYKKPSLRSSKTSGHICVQAPVDAQLSKLTLTFTHVRLVEKCLKNSTPLVLLTLKSAQHGTQRRGDCARVGTNAPTQVALFVGTFDVCHSHGLRALT